MFNNYQTIFSLAAFRTIFAPRNAIYKNMKFEDYSISNEIKKSLAKLNFRRPTDIQYKSIPPILKGEDVLAIAQTGTGKTAAFAIPVIHTLHTKKIKRRSDGINV